MTNKLNKNSAGLSLGIILVLVHLLWFIIILLGLAQPLLSWIVESHFVKINIEIAQFNFITATLTLIRAFIGGYIIGWLFAFIYNKLAGGKK